MEALEAPEAPEAPNPKTYWVYHLAPTSAQPTWHYGYFSTTLPVQELPDIHRHKPQWLFCEETRRYTTVSPRQWWVGQSRARRLTTRVATRLRAFFNGI